ncbi:MAG: argininosuccinate lyase [Candidatus Kapabacteria bacterium]|nr:argininosuccinate lyase [Candidatus Kapabacteria bacterium]
MKPWDKGAPIDALMEQFTVGRDRDVDTRLARWDVVGSIAHAEMLGTVGLISDDERRQLTAALSELLEEIDRNGIVIDPACEDIHSHVEAVLTQKLGDVGKKIHTGRSRNDQVLVDLKLFLRHELRSTRMRVRELADLLITLAEKYNTVELPGYTHFQIAMPSSFGLWFGGYAEALIEDLRVLDMGIDAANANPLGSAAGYGTSLPLDRGLTTRALNFDRVHVTSTFAQMSRGRTEKLAAIALAQPLSTLARLAADVVQYASQNYGFITLPEAFTTGSSIMPHKRNPDVFEVLRARCNRLQSAAHEIATMLTNLPSGYHRDMQFIKDVIVDAIDEAQLLLDVALHVVPHITPVQNLLQDPSYDPIYSVARVEELVRTGIPFRDAYRMVAEELKSGTFTRPTTLPTGSALGSVGNPGLEELRGRMMTDY